MADVEKKKRAPAKPRTVYVLYKNIVDANGNPDIELVGVYAKGGAVISAMDADKEVRFSKTVVNNSNE